MGFGNLRELLGLLKGESFEEVFELVVGDNCGLFIYLVHRWVLSYRGAIH